MVPSRLGLLGGIGRVVLVFPIPQAGRAVLVFLEDDGTVDMGFLGSRAGLESASVVSPFLLSGSWEEFHIGEIEAMGDNRFFAKCSFVASRTVELEQYEVTDSLTIDKPSRSIPPSWASFGELPALLRVTGGRFIGAGVRIGATRLGE